MNEIIKGVEKMSNQDLKEKFIELRIQDETFEAIAEKLKVSKQTLIKWSKEDEIKETITTAHLMKYQSILKIYEQNRQGKIEYFASLSKKMKDELKKRDLSKVRTENLLKLILYNDEKLSRLIPSKEYGGGFTDCLIEINPSFFLNPED